MVEMSEARMALMMVEMKVGLTATMRDSMMEYYMAVKTDMKKAEMTVASMVDSMVGWMVVLTNNMLTYLIKTLKHSRFLLG